MASEVVMKEDLDADILAAFNAMNARLTPEQLLLFQILRRLKANSQATVKVEAPTP